MTKSIKNWWNWVFSYKIWHPAHLRWTPFFDIFFPELYLWCTWCYVCHLRCPGVSQNRGWLQGNSNLSGTFNLPPNPSWLKYLMTFVIFSGPRGEHSVRHFARDVQPPFHDPWELGKCHPGHRRQPGLLGQDNTRQLDPTEGRLQVKETRHVLVIATLQLAPVTLFFVQWSQRPPVTVLKLSLKCQSPIVVSSSHIM